MKFLIPDPMYPDREDQMEAFAASFRRDVNSQFSGSARIFEVDAGPSASIPAYLLHLASNVADGIALFAGPMIVLESLKWWKKRFETATAFLKSKGLSYSIDTEAAAVLAAEEAVRKVDEIGELEIVSVTRHWVNLGGVGSDYRTLEPGAGLSEDPSNQSEIGRHLDAVKQLNVRYLVLLRCGTEGFTAIVERDGTVTSVEPLGP